jgi:hypothetical protein
LITHSSADLGGEVDGVWQAISPGIGLPAVIGNRSINWTTALRLGAHFHIRRQAVGHGNFDFDDGGFGADDSARIEIGKQAAKCI